MAQLGGVLQVDQRGIRYAFRGDRYSRKHIQIQPLNIGLSKICGAQKPISRSIKEQHSRQVADFVSEDLTTQLLYASHNRALSRRIHALSRRILPKASQTKHRKQCRESK